MKKRWILIVLLLAAAGGVTWWILKPEPAALVNTERVKRVDRLASVVTASGDIRAREFVDIQAEVPAVITDITVREGVSVARGDVLIRLEDKQFRSDVTAARATAAATEADADNATVAVATAEANLAFEVTALENLKVEEEQARISRDRARDLFDRKRDLHERRLISPEEFEMAESELRLAEQKLRWAEARVEQGRASLNAMRTRVDAAKTAQVAAARRVEGARANLARAEDELSKCEIRAPLGGLVTKLNVETGERAVPGNLSNPQATLMTIADMSVVEAEILVDETDIVDVKVGNVAEVEVDAIRDLKIAGVVEEVGQSPTQAQSTSTSNQEGKDFKVVIRLTQPPANLRPGFSATAKITTATREQCLTIPIQALTMREVEVDTAGNYVRPPPDTAKDSQALGWSGKDSKKELEGAFVVDQGISRFQPVKTGITGDMEIEILDGLTEGTEVVTGPFKTLRVLEEHDRVQVNNDSDKRHKEKRPAKVE